MDPRTQERVERWESRPFSGGRDELVSLADREFSGAVEAAGTWLFMLNGRVVGVVDGEIEDALDAGGTVYDASDPALPLLAAMVEQGGETRAKYYTNETPLSEVDRKLTQGSFTGYIELSEQVLSGDYYAVYYGGRRMAAAYIGNAERLLTGEEAFERADDEVGIYEVVDVDVEVTDIPGSEAPSASDGASAAPAGGSEADATDADDPGSTAAVIDDAEDADRDDPSTADVGAGRADADESGVADTEPPESSPDRADATGSEAAASSAADAGITTTEGEPTAADETGVTTGTQSSETGVTTDGASADRADAGAEAAASGANAAGSEGQGGAERAGREAGTAAGSTSGETASGGEAGTASGGAAPGAAGDGSGEDEEPDERFKEEARWRETRQIPSIDPDASSDDAGDDRRGRAGTRRARGSRQGSADGSRGRSSRGRSTQGGQRGSGRGTSTADRSGGSAGSSGGAGTGGAGRSSTRSGPEPETVASTEQALRSDMLEREDKIDQLTQRVTDLEARRKELAAERDELAAENQELSATVDRLQARIEELEAELERLRGQGTGGAAAAAASSSAGDGVSLSPQQALDQTNVFVRYGSKSEPTLASAHDGDAGRGEVAENLRLERHTQFEADDAVVVGQPYDEFVENTMQYRFVEWLVGTVLFEIRDTGHADALGDLYDVIPRIDRVELSAEISLEEDDTENVPDRVTFDVAAFDKRGTPLAVANCNDSRDPATREMLESLEADASAVNANYPELGAAVVVTSSFFDPGALEVAEEATTGGFLSRGSKLSYVNLSRKQGYHLCLVEDRSGGFHLTVPEL